MKKIGVNLLQYTDIQGVEVYAKNILENLIKENSNYNFVFFVNQISAGIFNFKKDNVKLCVKNFNKLTKIRLIFYQQLGLIFQLKKQQVDLLYCPSIAAPIFYRKKIITIHDLASIRFKDEAGIFSRIYQYLSFLSTKFFSLKVVTISNFSKKEITDLLKIKSSEIEIISPGLSKLVDVSEQRIITILNKFDLINKKYFLYVGNLRPRKNIIRLLEVWSRFILENKDYFFVVAGKNNIKKIKDNIKEANVGNVFFTGIISEEEKSVLYRRCVGLLFPSFYEGFGLPVLEAQSVGIPVITSNTSCLPEVAGPNSALYVDPYDSESILRGIKKIADPLFEKKEIIENGYKNLNKFSWNLSAKKLLGLFDEILK